MRRQRIIGPSFPFLAQVVPPPTGGGGPPPDPAAIFTTSLLAWWDGSDGYTGSGATARTIDRTTNNNTLINYDATVTINSSALNGKGGFVYHANGGLYSGNSPGNGVSWAWLGSAGAFFATVIPDLAPDSSRVLSIGRPSDGNTDGASPRHIRIYSAVTPTRFVCDCNNVAVATFNYVDGSPYRLAMVFNSTTLWLYVNGVPTDGGVTVGGTINIGGVGDTSLGLGGTFYESQLFAGTICNAFFVSVTPNSTQLAQVEAYQKDRYALT